MSIKLDYAVPSSALAEHVNLFYWFRADIPLMEDAERADHAQIRFRLKSGGASYRFIDGTGKDVADAHIDGPTTGAFQVRAMRPVEALGAGLTPAGWAALEGIDASSAMINRAVDLGDLVGNAVAEGLLRQLGEAPDFESKRACCEAILLRLMGISREKVLHFVRKVDGWLCETLSPNVEALVRATAPARRQVERKCPGTLRRVTQAVVT